MAEIVHAASVTEADVTVSLRPYRDSDAEGWLRCRLLGFFRTDYFDDVLVVRPRYSDTAICLVAHDSDEILGLIDTEVVGSAATIENVAVLPSVARRGIASALLEQTLHVLAQRKVLTIDAWTREDVAANSWYQASGFVESFRYLHVMKESGDDASGLASPVGLSQPIRAFMHAPIEMEAELRNRYQRVYICRQYLRPVDLARHRVG